MQPRCSCRCGGEGKRKSPAATAPARAFAPMPDFRAAADHFLPAIVGEADDTATGKGLGREGEIEEEINYDM